MSSALFSLLAVSANIWGLLESEDADEGGKGQRGRRTSRETVDS